MTSSSRRVNRLFRSRTFAILVVIALLLPMIGVMGVSAQAPSNFEIEGNLVDDPNGGTDWLVNGAVNSDAVKISDFNSQGGGKDPNIFSPAGKILEPHKWSIRDGKVGPGQNELTNVSAQPFDDTDHDGNGINDYYMAMSLERVKKEGTFFLMFEFNKIAWNGVGGTLDRSTGDLIVGYELKGNPTDPDRDLTVQILKYFEGGSNCVGTDGVYGSDLNGTFCIMERANGEALGDFGAATMNGASINAAGWGSTGADGLARNTIPAFEFAEAAINLSRLGIERTCPGFGSMYAATISSLEPTADMKDLGPPQNFPIDCGAKISIAPDDVNEVGDAHTFTVDLQKDLGSGTFEPAGGEQVEVTLTHSVTGGDIDVDTTNSTCDVWVGGVEVFDGAGTDSAGECDIVFDSDTAGIVTGHAEVTLTLGGESFPVETDGAGDNSDDAIKRFVDAEIDIVPDDVNEVGQSHTFTATVQKDLGDGNGLVAAGSEQVEVTLTHSVTGGDIDVDTTNSTCDVWVGGEEVFDGAGTNSAGECNVAFDSDITGTISAHAAVSLQMATAQGNITVARESDGTGNNSDDPVKRFVDAEIDIDPDDTNGIGESHTFTATVQKDLGDGNGLVAAGSEQVEVTLTHSVTGGDIDVDTTNSTCDVWVGGVEVHDGAGTDPAGECDVVFDSDTAGTVTGHATVTLAMVTDQGNINVTRSTDGTGNNSNDAVKTFVDGTLVWLKHDGEGNLLGGATFEVCRTHNWNSNSDPQGFDDIADVCVSVVDNSSPDTDTADGKFQLEDLILGRYTIRETAAPAGYQIDPSTETVELSVHHPSNNDGDDDLNIDDDVPVFVNPLLFKMFVITCNQADNSVVNSQVTALTESGAVAAPQGLTGDVPQQTQPSGDLDETALSLAEQICAATNTSGDIEGAAEYYNMPNLDYDITLDVYYEP